MSEFGSESCPLRPSSLGKLLKCPMSVVLGYYEHSEGGPGAQTGSVVHRAIEVFHREGKEAAIAAIPQVLQEFPDANEERARRWITAYVDDPKNQSAPLWLEQRVTLRIRADGTIPATNRDPEPGDVVVTGTLDQVRLDEDGVKRVWDVKTGESLTADEAVAEYQAQQAAYVLAARQTLDAEIMPGGLIFMAGYDKPRARRFIPMRVTVEQCEAMLREAHHEVMRIRRGERPFRPSSGACGFCPFRWSPKCHDVANSYLGYRK